MMSEKNEKVKSVPLNMKVWRCKMCHMQLGTLNPECTELQIKYKDLYLFIQGGTVRTICKKCGTPNVIVDENVDGSVDEDVPTKA